MKYKSLAAWRVAFRSRRRDLYALATLPFFNSQRGDSGQNHMPSRRGMAGTKAEPNCSRQAILPVLTKTKFAQVPIKMPNAVQTCQDMTSPPRIVLGATSAE